MSPLNQLIYHTSVQFAQQLSTYTDCLRTMFIVYTAMQLGVSETAYKSLKLNNLEVPRY